MFWRLRDILYICDVNLQFLLISLKYFHFSNTNLNKVEDYARF